MMADLNFRKKSFGERLLCTLKVDFSRMLGSRFFYIMVGACLLMPILILVMTTMMDGSVTVDQQTGKETVIEGFDNLWQIIGTVSGSSDTSADASSAAMDMSLTSMCNVNMLYFLIAVLVCVFVSDDFRYGYVKNLFAIRAKKTDYVASNTIVCIFGSGMMIIAFFIGSLIGGAVSSLPFDMIGFNLTELILCLLCKVILVAIFVPIYLLAASFAKDKLWLSLILSFTVGMFLFMMIPILTPLNAGILHLVLCFAGGAVLGIGLGALSNLVLTKTDSI